MASNKSITRRMESSQRDTSPAAGNSNKIQSISQTLTNRKKVIGYAVQSSSKDVFREFCEQSTLHGLKYIYRKEAHIITRLCWAFSFSLSVIAAFYFIWILYKKWEMSPIILSTSPKPVALETIPFPAITFCTKMSSCESFVKKHTYPHISQVHQTRFQFRKLTCCTSNGVHPKFLYRNLTDKAMLNISSNKFNFIDWNTERGYGPDSNIYTVPARKLVTLGSVYLRFPGDVNKTDLLHVHVHSPTDAPKPMEIGEWHSVPYDHYFYLNVKPRLVDSSESLRHVKLEHRQCYFQSERHLKYFRTYSQSNCQMECVLNQTLAKCKLLPHFLPEMYGMRNRSTRDITDHCFLITYLLSKFQQCKCLPPCKDLTYTVTTRSFRRFRNTESSEASAIIKFEAGTIYGLLRSEFITLSDFIASTGGLLGLFVGFSIMNIMEIVHFTALSVWTFLKNKKVNN